MEKAKINTFQFFVLIVHFLLGSSIVLAIGADAKQDAWIAILLALAAGMILFFVYYFLYKQFPDLPLTEYIPIIVGKYLGRFIGLLYILYFLYIGTRILRSFGDLLLSSTLPNTPLFVINLLMICTIVYVLYLGIEVLARTGEFLFLVLALIFNGTILLVIASGLIDLENLLPIFEGGWQPIREAVFPSLLTFPFGEMIVFTMLLPYFNNQSSLLKVSLFGMFYSGMFLVITTIMNFSVLGPDIAIRSLFPLITTFGRD